MGQLIHEAVRPAAPELPAPLSPAASGVPTAGTPDDERARVLDSFVAVDPRTRAILAKIEHFAGNRAPVLICGERGTGKELLASLLHRLGTDAEAPLINIHCGWLPPASMEAELFGDERNGLVRRGVLEMAGAGTVVLDEIAALPLRVQAKLLEVLDHSSVQRMGGSARYGVFARIVALTRMDL